MRQLANLYAPTEALGVRYGNLEQAVFWYRQACAAGYANAQVDFYEFARLQADQGNDAYLEEAIACLEDAIRQGHRSAIISGAFRAAFIEQDYKTGFFLYALFEDTEPSRRAALVLRRPADPGGDRRGGAGGGRMARRQPHQGLRRLLCGSELAVS